MSRPCPECGGSGKISVPDNSGDTAQVECGHCGGQGWIRGGAEEDGEED
jgi:DnaJ-class molecular chaperone